MLYDPKWEVQVKANPSLGGLVAWLETMPVDGTYNWRDCKGGCLLDLYFTAATGQPSVTGGEHVAVCGGIKNYGSIALSSPWTFGAALTRAREALASRA